MTAQHWFQVDGRDLSRLGQILYSIGEKKIVMSNVSPQQVTLDASYRASP
jgi:hypothetical protein